MEAQNIDLLYYFSRMWDLWGNISLVTIFVDRTDDEYFSGFCCLQWLVTQWRSDGIRMLQQQLRRYEFAYEEEEEEGQTEEEQEEQEQSSEVVNVSLEDDTFRWFNMSLIFRATPFGGNRMPT